MKSPFPGMDPYLEWHWGDVHTRLTTYASDQLATQLPSDLRVRVEEYVGVDEENGDAIAFRPDVGVEERRGVGERNVVAGEGAAVGVAERVVVSLALDPPVLRYLRIVDVRTGNRLVTAIEFLSIANKKGKGRAAYRKKQRKLTSGGANLVEIDLLRAGKYVLLAPQGIVPAKFQRPYRVCVYRAHRPEEAELYRVPLRAPLPAVKIPLRDTDQEVQLNLQQLVQKSYENGQYDDIDYKAEPMPPLDSDDARWADALLREKGLR
jgi:hypothetical protein